MKWKAALIWFGLAVFVIGGIPITFMIAPQFTIPAVLLVAYVVWTAVKEFKKGRAPKTEQNPLNTAEYDAAENTDGT